ncbi:hypothetical protein B0H17DRAFT_1330314, partial [Mycena rosella]
SWCVRAEARSVARAGPCACGGRKLGTGVARRGHGRALGGLGQHGEPGVRAFERAAPRAGERAVRRWQGIHTEPRGAVQLRRCGDHRGIGRERDRAQRVDWRGHGGRRGGAGADADAAHGDGAPGGATRGTWASKSSIISEHAGHAACRGGGRSRTTHAKSRCRSTSRTRR